MAIKAISDRTPLTNEELAARLFTEGSVLTQVLDAMRIQRSKVPGIEGETRLAMAILRSACEDLVGSSKRRRIHAAYARDWILIGDVGAGRFTTFDGCCDLLGIDPDFLREKLLAADGEWADRRRSRTRTRRATIAPVEDSE